MADESGVRMPLSDVRVIDLTLARAGPTCVRQLADWGADVIRIDAPASGAISNERNGSDFQNLHRNKRSLVLDLKSAEGIEIFGRLVDSADVLVENMRPAVKHRLGVDYDRVRQINPRLVYGSISGFGQDGPYADRGGVDQIAQGLGGLMSITGEAGRGPMRVGIPVADLAAGLYLAIGILVALHERQTSGEGQWVQTSLLEAMVAMLDFQAVQWTIDGRIPGQEGTHHPTMIPMGCFAAQDGYVNVAAPGGRLLEKFCDAADLGPILTDERFDSTAKRSANRKELNAIIEERLRSRPVAEWVELLNKAGVPAGPVNDMAQVFDDPQVQHLEMVNRVRHPLLGELDLIRNAVTMSRYRDDLRPTPLRGQHSDSVLHEIGLTDDDVAGLRSRGVVA
jgi:crotonobetainyl-CoA:carnitine CoA-transferase CaiB-like acyl-CoA transferase